jgi:hypothetical protein
MKDDLAYKVVSVLGAVGSRGILGTHTFGTGNAAFTITAKDDSITDATFAQPALRTLTHALAITVTSHAIQLDLEVSSGVYVPITAAALVTALNNDAGFSAVAVASLPSTSTGASNVSSTTIPSTPLAQDFNGYTVDHAGYSEGLVVLSLGAYDDTSTTLDCKIQHSADGTTWEDLDGAAFPVSDGADDQHRIRTGVLRFTTENIKRYIRAVPTLTGAWVEYSVLFVFIGGQYLNSNGPTHAFTV